MRRAQRKDCSAQGSFNVRIAQRTDRTALAAGATGPLRSSTRVRTRVHEARAAVSRSATVEAIVDSAEAAAKVLLPGHPAGPTRHLAPGRDGVIGPGDGSMWPGVFVGVSRADVFERHPQ